MRALIETEIDEGTQIRLHLALARVHMGQLGKRIQARQEQLADERLARRFPRFQLTILRINALIQSWL